VFGSVSEDGLARRRLGGCRGPYRAQMPMKTNLRNYALKALEAAKEDLRRDKYLLPVAFIVTEDEVFDFNLQFEDVDQKKSVYAELVEVAKQKCAKAIITINDTTIINDLEAMSSGPTRATRADRKATQDSIFLTISGPSIPTCSVSLSYSYGENGVIFGDPVETVGDILNNLFPGWPTV
jgi:hypothetical protein